MAYVIPNKLNKIIKKHKDPIPTYNCSNVVYKINCKKCDVSYVGQTSRQLMTRIKEHRLNINRPSSSLTAISEHRLEGYEFDWENVRVLDREPMFKRRMISEMVHIQQQVKGFNRQEDTEFLSNAYYPNLRKYI